MLIFIWIYDYDLINELLKPMRYKKLQVVYDDR